ncbi:MAG: MaoC family dehydratase [Myxococcota bacterium]
MAGHFFEDFRVGQVLTHAVPRTLTEGDRSLYIALTGDRSPVASAASTAAHYGFDGFPLHDWLVFHTVFGKTVTDVSLNAVANLGYAEVEFVQPVFPGDTLASSSTVIGLKQNSSGKTGIVWVSTSGTNQRGEEVMRFKRWVMVNKRDPASPAAEAVVPDVLDVVDPAPLLEARFPSKVTPLPTDRGPALGALDAGSVIAHDGAMTIEEADHMQVTRLYQNTAKVHFDPSASARFGKRLVYGGHIISLCSALAYDGLQSAVGVLAMNAGTHAAPCFAGDVLRARSEVLETRALRDDLGALRVRLVGIKNDGLDVPLRVDKDGRQRHHPSVVLDVDLWLAVRA